MEPKTTPVLIRKGRRWKDWFDKTEIINKFGTFWETNNDNFHKNINGNVFDDDLRTPK